LHPIEGRLKHIGASAHALIRNASPDDCVLGVDEFPVPALAVRQEAIEEVRGLVGQSALSDAGGSATGLSATGGWGRAVAGDGANLMPKYPHEESSNRLSAMFISQMN
jgi:hypothetical protein